jgi:hypothetical protein
VPGGEGIAAKDRKERKKQTADARE